MHAEKLGLIGQGNSLYVISLMPRKEKMYTHYDKVC